MTNSNQTQVEFSEITGKLEPCTIRPGFLGGDGKYYNRFADIDLYGLLVECDPEVCSSQFGIPVEYLNDFGTEYGFLNKYLASQNKKSIKLDMSEHKTEKLTKAERIELYADMVESGLTLFE